MNKAKGSTVGSAAKTLGFSGLWAGLGPRIIMIGTLTALQWFIYDFVKVSSRYLSLYLDSVFIRGRFKKNQVATCGESL